MTDISTKRYNLDNFEASFREFLQNEDVSAPTLKNYLSDLRHFMGWFTFVIASVYPVRGAKQSDKGIAASSTTDVGTPRNDIIAMIDFEAVTSYKTYLESNALPVKSINRRLSTLRKFCTFCIQQNWMKENVAKRVANVGATPSLSLRGVSARQDDEAISLAEIATLPMVARNDMIAEFKQHLLSEQAKQNVETRHGMSLQKNSDINLALDDVQEFLSICHPA